MTEEVSKYLENLYARLLENRYRYYVLDSPVISDFEYDFLEKHYNALVQQTAVDVGAKVMDMVDFDPNDPLAIEAKNRVDSGTDHHSLWEKEMQPIWDRLGRSKHNKEKVSE